ncbi:MAG: MFS transporter [Bacteroidia bacterium]|nr:MFS transporter [Bacteroidia bacterium]
MSKSKLFSRDFILILAANFLLYLGFYLLLPIFPFYLSESFGADKATIGVVLSCYTIAALVIRPFSGYLLDAFQRKPLYMAAYVVFTLMFGGYIAAWCLAVFVIMRVLHGFAFGMVTVGGNTIVIDILPSERRGEGVGYYGMANNFAMCVGPMVGLFMHGVFSFEVIFLTAVGVCALGLFCASLIKTKVRPLVQRPPLSLDRFILLRGIPGGLALMLLSIPYGLTTTYIAMYALELNVNISSGLFFSLMAIGIASSRIFSGKWVDKGYTAKLIEWSSFSCIVVFGLLGICGFLNGGTLSTWVSVIFLTAALLMGVCFGVMFPAYNNYFVSLAPNKQRGTAVSTYLTSWDVGIGLGLAIGGTMVEFIGFAMAYICGALLAVVSWAWFKWYVALKYEQQRIS